MIRRYLLLALASLVAAACSTSDDSQRAGAGCAGKCDSPDLTVAPLSLGPLLSCRATLDTSTTDAFFASDAVTCRAAAPPSASELSLRAYVSFRSSSSGDYLFGGTIDRAADPPDVAIGSVHRSAWPVVANLTGLVTSSSDELSLRMAFATQQTVDGAALSTTPLELPYPFDLWRVTFIPAPALRGLAQLYVLDSAYQVPLPTTPLCVGGVTAGRDPSVRWSRIAQDDGELLREMLLPAAKQPGFALPVDLKLFRADGQLLETHATLSAPGYYAIEADGSIRPAVDADFVGLTLPGRADARSVDGDAGVGDAHRDSDAGDALARFDAGAADSDADVGHRDADAGVTTFDVRDGAARDVDACAGQCSALQVCVAGGCLYRSQQTTGAPCDGSDDADCAAGYLCVLGQCRYPTQQTTGAPCGGQNSDCAGGYICAANTCHFRGQQTTGAVCDNDDADCAASYRCVNGSCAYR